MSKSTPQKTYTVDAFVQQSGQDLYGIMGIQSASFRKSPLNKIMIPIDTKLEDLVPQNIGEWWRHKSSVHGQLQRNMGKRYTAEQRAKNWFPATPANNTYKSNVFQRNLMVNAPAYAQRLAEIVIEMYDTDQVTKVLLPHAIRLFSKGQSNIPHPEIMQPFNAVQDVAYISFTREIPTEIYEGIPLKGHTKERSSRGGNSGPRKPLS